MASSADELCELCQHPHLGIDSCRGVAIQGLQYRTEFIDEREEAGLLEAIVSLPLTNAKYQQYTARRRTMNFGAGYDFAKLTTTQAPPIPPFLTGLQRRVAGWVGIDATRFVQALVSEYQPGTPLGWHRDVPDYELIAGISLVSATRIRFRPYPWHPSRRKEVFALNVQPRSAYILSGSARWEWQHSVPPVKTLRYSITFRTRRSQERA